ncbi:hypothetical protein VCR15J2_460105 [Vibrio coralliirubri]|nr:hypothetical protein VCR15J2_460105 [Vibrio coralliirubri]
MIVTFSPQVISVICDFNTLGLAILHFLSTLASQFNLSDCAVCIKVHQIDVLRVGNGSKISRCVTSCSRR